MSEELTLAELEHFREDPTAFRKWLKIDAGDSIMSFDAAMDPWQRADFEAMDEGWRHAIHRDRPDSVRRSYCERGRGHSKTTDNAINTTYGLMMSKFPLRGIVAAADKEQAGLLKDAIDRLVILNPGLKRFIDVQQFRIKNHENQAVAQILSSDADTKFGKTPDFVICDELTHWTGKKGKALWTAIFSAVAKRKHCLVSIISNAGVGRGKSWQWNIREFARTSDRWHFSRIDGPQASWLTQEDLAEQRAVLPAAAYKRLWLNEWTQGAGDALEPSDIQACLTQTGPVTVSEMRENNYIFIAGLDLGVKHDHSALVVWGIKPGMGRVRLAYCHSWAPGPNGDVELEDVKEKVLWAHKHYNILWCGFDPSQAILMSQQLAKEGVPMSQVTFVGKNLDRMARDLLQAFRTRCLDLYDDGSFVDDLHRLTIVERKYGFKLEAISDDSGHADRAIAGAIALPFALELSQTPISMEASSEDQSSLVISA